MADRAAHQATQHVAATLLRWQHAVAHEERGGTGMLGDDAQRHVGLRITAVGVAGELAGAGEQRLEQVRLEHVVDALQQHGEALEPEARVNVLRGQVAEDRALRIERVLHEHEVVELEVALVVDGRAAGLAVRVTAVVVQLGVRPARPCGVRPPVVVVRTQALQP